MEKSPKYIFEKTKWEPKLAEDGRPSDELDSWGPAIKTWWLNDRTERVGQDNKPTFIESVQALIDILKVTEERNGTQWRAWYNSRTKEEKDKRIIMMIGDRVR